MLLSLTYLREEGKKGAGSRRTNTVFDDDYDVCMYVTYVHNYVQSLRHARPLHGVEKSRMCQS